MFIVADAIQMTERPDTGSVRFFMGLVATVAASSILAQVMNDGACSRKRLWVIVEAEAGQFRNAKLFAQDALTVVALEGPVFEAGLDSAGAFEKRSLSGFEQLLRPWKQSFARAEQLKLVAKGFVGARPGEFGSLEFAGGKIDESEANRRAGGMRRDSGKKIVLANIQYAEVGGRTWCDDAHDFAANELLPGTGLLHLVADGDFEAGAN